MYKMYNLLFLLILSIFLNGCINYMAFTKGQESIDITNKSVALLTVKISNQYKPQYLPHPYFILINGEKNLSYLIHTYSPVYRSEIPYKYEENKFMEYLLSFYLEPGTNNIRWITCEYQDIWIKANAVIPLDLKIDIKPNTISYLGHIDAIIRERKTDNEEMAGSVVPLIDQTISHFPRSTFDVVVKDEYNEDMKAYYTEYPGLKKLKVEKNILPEWTRPEQRKKE